MGPTGACTPCREAEPCYRARESGDGEGNPGWSAGTVLPEATRSGLIWKGSEESFSNGMTSSDLQENQNLFYTNRKGRGGKQVPGDTGGRLLMPTLPASLPLQCARLP